MLREYGDCVTTCKLHEPGVRDLQQVATQGRKWSFWDRPPESVITSFQKGDVPARGHAIGLRSPLRRQVKTSENSGTTTVKTICR